MEHLCQQKKGSCCRQDKAWQRHQDHGKTDPVDFPVAAYVESASPHEVELVEETIDSGFTEYALAILIGDKAYDSDKLDQHQQLFEDRGIELIAQHKRNRKKERTQDGRKFRPYRRRWKVECLFAWL